MALVNVKLQAEDVERVRALRASGVRLSDLVRAAIRAEYVRRVRPAGTRKPSEVVRRILDALPRDPGTAARPAATDRRAVRAFVAAKLRRGKP